MWQEVAIFMVAVMVIVYIGYKSYRLITDSKADSPCHGCPGCSLMDEIKKHKECSLSKVNHSKEEA